MDAKIATAQALLPFFNAWSAAYHGAADVRRVRDLERDLWAKVVEVRLLIATDPVLVGRWIRETLGGSLNPRYMTIDVAVTEPAAA